MKFLVVLMLLFLTACEIKEPTTAQIRANRISILSHGYAMLGMPGGGKFFTETDRINLMKSPVTVLSIGAVSHGVFREKYKTYDVTVKDSDGDLYTLNGATWESLKVGDVLK